MVSRNSASIGTTGSYRGDAYHASGGDSRAKESRPRRRVSSAAATSADISTLHHPQLEDIATPAIMMPIMPISDIPHGIPGEGRMPRSPRRDPLEMVATSEAVEAVSPTFRDDSSGDVAALDDGTIQEGDSRRSSRASGDAVETLVYPEHDEAKHRRQSKYQRREAKLPKLRQRNLETRIRAYGKRGGLAESRRNVSDADELFMRTVRSRTPRLGSVELELIQNHSRLQAMRDAYGPLEEAYNAVEERLDSQEYEVMTLEKKIFEHRNSALDEHDWVSLSSSSNGSDSENSQIFENIHPLYAAYLSKQGDANLLQEEHAALVSQHTRLHENQRMRHRVGADILPEDQEDIDNFHSNEARILEELRRANAEIEILRKACINDGLLVEDTPILNEPEIDITMASLEENEDGYIDLSEISESLAEFNRFPDLQEYPGSREDQQKSSSLISTFKLGDTGHRIACWLLHKLRSSCGEVELLARYSSDELARLSRAENSIPATDLQEWQEGVLDFWFSDSTKLPPSAYNYRDSTVITTLPRSPISVDLAPELYPLPRSPLLVNLEPEFCPLPSSPEIPADLPIEAPSISGPMVEALISPPLPSPMGATFEGTVGGSDSAPSEVCTSLILQTSQNIANTWAAEHERDLMAPARRIQLTVRVFPSDTTKSGLVESGHIEDFALLLGIKKRRERRRSV